MPLATPEPDTVAIEVPELLHVPPLGLHVRAVVAPAHIDAVPPIAPGVPFTVTCMALKQPPSV